MALCSVRSCITYEGHHRHSGEQGNVSIEMEVWLKDGLKVHTVGYMKVKDSEGNIML